MNYLSTNNFLQYILTTKNYYHYYLIFIREFKVYVINMITCNDDICHYKCYFLNVYISNDNTNVPILFIDYFTLHNFTL